MKICGSDRACLLLFLSLWCTAPGVLHAQMPASVRDSLSVGRRVRIDLLDRSRITGRVQRADPDDLVLTVLRYRNVHDVTAHSLVIPAESIGSIQVSAGTHWKTGAVIGGAVLGTTVFAMRLIFRGPDSGECNGGCLAGSSVLGVGLGAVCGAAVGSLVLRWRFLW